MEQRLCSEWVVIKDNGSQLELECAGDASKMAKDITLIAQYSNGYKHYLNEDGHHVLEIEFSSASQKDKFYWEILTVQ